MAALQEYVDPDATGAGNGNSPTDAYTALTTWESTEQQDLTDGGGDTMTCTCLASSGTADTAKITVSGWTTGVANYILIEAASTDRASASGWDATKYRLQVTDDHCLVVNEDYFRVGSLQIGGLYSSVAAKYAINIGSVGTSDIRIYNCYLDADGTQRGIIITDVDAIVKIWNTIMYDMDDRGVTVSNSTSVVVYNCIASLITGDAIRLVNGSLTVKNTASFNNTDDFHDDIASMVIDYNASDDNDGTNNVAESGGGVAWPDDFIDAANGDFTLKSGSGLVGGGTDDPGSGLYSDDINGDTRTSPWDVGADEFISAAGTTISVVASDGIVLDESAGRVATYRVSASDGLALNDSDSGLASLLASASDSITLDDNVSGLLSLLAAATDSITLDDTSTRTITYQVASVDGITLGDTSTVTFKLLVMAADGIVLDDAASVTITLAASALDSIVVNDTAMSLLSLLASALDGITLQDISTASLPSDITGKLSITFSTKKSTITFTIKKPSVAFTEKKPSITVTGV